MTTTVTATGSVSGVLFLFLFLVPGLKELGLIALVALALYGRTGSRLLRMTPYGRTVEPWLNLVGLARRDAAPQKPKPNAPAGAARRRPQGRVFWALALTAAAAVAAWVATRLVVLGGSGAAP